MTEKQDNKDASTVGGDLEDFVRDENDKIYPTIENFYRFCSERKLMVTHIHPHKSKAEIFGFEGSKAVRKAIETFKPDIAINAHMHEAGGIEEKIGKTRVINVSRKEKVFEI